MVEFRDHYSLGQSTELRFRGKKDQKVVVLDGLAAEKQLVMVMKNKDGEGASEDPHSTSIELGIHSRNSVGATFLRAVATAASFFVLSVWFAFSIQCIFFLFMNVVGTYTPAEWTSNPPIANLIGCLLACPVLVDSLAKTLTMSLACTVDCWRGIATHPSSLWKSIGKLTSEWLILAVFFGVPTLTFVVTTVMSKERALDGSAEQNMDDNERGWHELTMLSWFLSVLIFQIIYMELCIFNEITSCHKLLVHFRNTTSILESIKTNLILTQRQKYSSVKRERYLVSDLDGDEQNDPSHLCGNRTAFALNAQRAPVQVKYTLGTRLTKLLRCFYDNIEVEEACEVNVSEENEDDDDKRNEKAITSETKTKRNYTIDEIFGNIRIVTHENWSLEKLWCSDPKKVASITVLNGKASVTQRQFISGYLCVAAGMALIAAALAAFLIWFDKSLAFIIAVPVVIIICCFSPMIVSLFKMGEHQKRKRRDLPEQGDDEETGSCDVIVSVWESVRITELKEWACYTSVAIEILAFFLWPMGSLFYYENTNIAIVFLVLGIHMVPRHYFNASFLLQDCGPIDDLDMSGLDLSRCRSISRRNDNEDERKREVKNKMFIANLIARVTRGTAKRVWQLALLFSFFIFFLAYYWASSSELFAASDGFVMGNYRWKSIVLADDFYWEAQPQLQYPTCEVGKGFTIPGTASVSLADFSFLGTLSFASPEESQPLLDQWFGNGTVIDDFEYVDNYRASNGLQDHPVEYKLFTIEGANSAVVAIRGSEARWDWLVDIQLWIGGVLADFIKNINPFGSLWVPILDEVVFLINKVQSDKLKEVSYYRFTSEFIETLYNGFDGRKYENLRVTGVSLGGGLSILTGAITGASAISFSGLNAMFSRRTFLPPITEEQLNTRVFNVIPQRDIIANIDEPGLLHQRLQCTAPKQDFLMGCHSMFRTLCELQYKCGSRGRPINCNCVSTYGYPEPIQAGDITWEEACSVESTAPGTA